MCSPRPAEVVQAAWRAAAAAATKSSLMAMYDRIILASHASSLPWLAILNYVAAVAQLSPEKHVFRC